METITIPYEDYKELLEESNMYKDMNRELIFIIRRSELNYRKNDLNFIGDIECLIKKYFPTEVKNRICELKRLEESEEK